MNGLGPAEERTARVRQLIAGEPRPTEGRDGYLRRVCLAACRELSASGVGVTVMAENDVRGISVASDPDSERIEELQFVLGEGPCIDALADRRPVLTADLSDISPTRWPGYAPAAYGAGIRAVFAFPLQIGAAGLGVMDVFRRRVGPLTADELSTALIFADVTVAAMLDRQEAAPGQDTDVEVNYHAELFQAQGMVMVQLGVSIGEALVRMRAYAYAENRRLDDVARDVVNRTLHFERDT